jgi:hypothetical protein
MALNPSGTDSPTAAATPKGQGYDTRYILFLPNLSDCLAYLYIEVLDS